MARSLIANRKRFFHLSIKQYSDRSNRRRTFGLNAAGEAFIEGVTTCVADIILADITRT
jgi:hypothetical protein